MGWGGDEEGSIEREGEGMNGLGKEGGMGIWENGGCVNGDFTLDEYDRG